MALTVGERIKYLRQCRKRTLDELAEELETTKTTLSRYENNKRIPDADFIIKLAKHYRVSADYILCLSDNPFSMNDFIRINNKTHPRTLSPSKQIRRV